MLRLVLASLVAVAIVGVALGESPPKEPRNGDFEVLIRDFDGSAGFTHVYLVTQDALTVSLENDFGKPAKVLCTLALEAAAANELSVFLATFPLEKLANEYVNPAVDDGLQLRFSIRSGSDTPRLIRVDNMYQADLARLCGRVAELVPKSCVRQRLQIPIQ